MTAPLPGQPNPPQQYAPPVSPPYAPQYGQPGWAPPPRKKSFWSSTGGVFAILGIVFGGVIVLCVGAAVVGNMGNRSATSKMEVELTSCNFTGSATLPSATVGYTVKNTGSSTRTARLKIEYRDSSGARLDTDTATVRDIKPGDTVRGEETTLLDAAPSGSGRCELVGVS